MKGIHLKATLFSLLFFCTVVVNAAVTIRYYNKDSETHTFEVEIAGSSKTVEFESSRTATVTIQGGGDEAKIKTECGWVTVEDDAHITIKDGCIEID